MSADNGTYILKYRNGYRVTQKQCIENLWFDANKQGWMNPIEVYRYFNGSRCTNNYITALKVADAMERCCPTEYGIKTLQYNKTWDYIMHDAKEKAKTYLKTIEKTDRYQPYTKNFLLDILELDINNQ